MNPHSVLGKPDFTFSAQRIAVFIDGCFWHGCPICKRIPSSNVEYWNRKIERNRTRDAAVDAKLKESGWTVLRIWEHQLNSMQYVIQRIKECAIRATQI